MQQRHHTLWGAAAIAVSVTLLSAAPASANDLLSQAFGGSAAFEPVADEALADMRGGYRGIAFNLLVNGSLNNLGNVETDIPEGVDVQNIDPSNVTLSIGLATLPNANGFLQFAEVNGNNNIVNNTMTLNVVIVEGGTADPASVLAGLGL
jgi:hypothetical protein